MKRVIRRKKVFISHVSTMEHPVLRPFTANSVLLNLSFTVHDKQNVGNQIMTQGVRLSDREYSMGKFAAYYKRKKQLRIKIENWLYEAAGNHCTIESKELIDRWW